MVVLRGWRLWENGGAGFMDFPRGSESKESTCNAGESQIRSQGQEDPLEGGMTTHPSILAWRMPWTEEPGRLRSMESQRVRHDWATNIFTFQCLMGIEFQFVGMEKFWRWMMVMAAQQHEYTWIPVNVHLKITKMVYFVVYACVPAKLLQSCQIVWPCGL